MTAPACRYNAAEGWLTTEDRPCPEVHCALLGGCATHVDSAAGLYTCPSCIGKVRSRIARITDLAAITDLDVIERDLGYSSTLLDEAEHGVETEAFNLVGPAAAPEQYAEHRRRLGLAYAERGWCDWPRAERFLEDDPHHPYAVLGRWDLEVRELYGPRSDLFVTISSAADYLIAQLAGPFPHTEPFERFASEVSVCLGHLEAVIHDSRAPEQGRHCPACIEADGEGPRLRKRYASHPNAKPGDPCRRRADGKPCDVCSGKLDTWHCPAVADHWWSETDYRARVDADYQQHATHLPALELAERVGVSLATVRRWTARTWDDETDGWQPPRLVSRRTGPDGRKLYSVKAAEGLKG